MTLCATMSCSESMPSQSPQQLSRNTFCDAAPQPPSKCRAAKCSSFFQKKNIFSDLRVSFGPFCLHAVSQVSGSCVPITNKKSKKICVFFYHLHAKHRTRSTHTDFIIQPLTDTHTRSVPRQYMTDIHAYARTYKRRHSSTRNNK